MIFSKQKKLDPRRRYGSKAFQNKVRGRQNYKRSYEPLDLSRKSIWSLVLGLRSRFFRVVWVAVFAVLAYFFVFSNYMVISDIQVSGDNRVDPADITKSIEDFSHSRTAFVPKTNFFLLTQSKLTARLNETVPFVKSVAHYKRSWPNKISIEIVERDPGFVLESAGRSYLIDDDGVVVNDSAEGLSLPIVTDLVEENFDIGKPLINTKLVAVVISTYSQWAGKITPAITEAKIPGVAGTEVQFVSAEGWTVFFDINRSVNTQLSSLALILSHEVSAKDRPNLAYIDLRLSKWAYICLKDTPCVAGASTEVPEEGQGANGAIVPPAPTPPPAVTPKPTTTKR